MSFVDSSPRRQSPSAEAHEALVVLGQLDLQRWDHEPMLRRAWQLRENLTIYDAMYVVLG